MTKLSRNSTTGKIITCTNLSDKLLRGGCCPSCEYPVQSPCPAVHKWNIPASVKVNLSGITLASEPQYWVSGNNSSPSGTVSWCNHTWRGIRVFDWSSVNGEYNVPINPYRGYSDRYFCGGSVDIPYQGSVTDYFLSQDVSGGDVCENPAGYIGPLLRRYQFESIRLTVHIQPYLNDTYRMTLFVGVIADPDTEEGVLYTIYYSLPQSYEVFRGYIDLPATPEEDRAGYNATGIVNAKDVAYQCTYEPCAFGYCQCIISVPGWGGTASLTQSEELYPFTVSVKEFGGNGDPGILSRYGNPTHGYAVGARLELDTDDIPHDLNLVVEYEVTYGDEQKETHRRCFFSGNSAVLFKNKELGQELGYTTIQIKKIYSPEVPNLAWDSSSGHSGLAVGVFDIADGGLFVANMTPLPEDDNCLPCSDDVCYTALCQVQIMNTVGISPIDAIISYEWRKDNGNWTDGGQAVVGADGTATLTTTECIGVNASGEAGAFVVEFRVTDISKENWLYMPELNDAESCVCGPIVPPLSCEYSIPPTPDPPEHVAGTPTKFSNGNEWHIVVRAALPTSEPPTEDGFEYFFECVEDSNLNSGWRNEDNVAGTYYSDGFPQIPKVYEVVCNPSYSFRLKIKDVECQSETGWSDAKSAGN